MLGNDSTQADSLVPLYNASGAPGRYAVSLTAAPNRCSAGAGFARAVTVFPGDTAVADFAVQCVERLQVVTRTTGPGIDPDGYQVIVANADGAGAADTVSAGPDDTLGIAGVSAGTHTIALAGVDPTCVAPPAVDRAVSASDSTLVTFTVACPAPAPPLDLHASAVGTDRVDLAWTPPAGSVVARYRIYRDGVLHDSSAATVFQDTGLPPFTAFVYQVSSVDPNGLEGVRSGPLAVRTRDATPPSSPASLTASATSRSRIALAWQAASDAETGVARYVVYRDGAEIARPAATSYADTGLADETTYSYEVSAINGDGLEGARSTPASATTHDDETAPPPPPSLTALATSTSRIELQWSAVGDPESGIRTYRVYRDGALSDSAAATSFADTGLAPGAAHSYEVSAVNGAGLEGAHSNPAAATTPSDGDGDLVVHTVTGGTGIPELFTIQVNKDEFLETQPIAPTGTIAFNRLVPQQYHVRIISLPGNCVVQDVNARKVTVIAGTTVETTFVVTCQ
jgi:chitodextrinase